MEAVKTDKRRSIRQCLLLLQIELLQYMSINEVIHSGDKKRKRKLITLLVVYVLVGTMLVVYIGGGAYALCMIGAAEAVPAYIVMVTSIVIFIFSMFKSGSILFQGKNYEMLIPLPMKPGVIVMSRMLSMYTGNLVMSALTMIPAGIVYGIFTKASVFFYAAYMLSIFVLPLIPLTAASAVGAVITAAGARMKHKNGVSTILSMLFLIAILIVSFFPMFGRQNITVQNIADISMVLKEKIHGLYPPAALFTEAVVNGSMTAYAAFIGISAAIFAAAAWIVQKQYSTICNALLSHSAKKNYVLEKQKVKSKLSAIYGKEIKRYFSSTVYVMNTSIGYVMMIGFSITMLFLGEEQMNVMFGVQGSAEIIRSIQPFILGMLGMMGTTTAVSVSLEGKQWWIAKSLPISAKQIFDSKILVNLTLAIPSCIAAALFSCAGGGFSALQSIMLFLIPLAYCLFASVAGVAVNLKFINFSWINEVDVIKQGVSTLLIMLIGLLACLAGVGMLFLLRFAYTDLMMCMIIVILFFATALIYKKIIKLDLRKLD